MIRGDTNIVGKPKVASEWKKVASALKGASLYAAIGSILRSEQGQQTFLCTFFFMAKKKEKKKNEVTQKNKSLFFLVSLK